MNLAWMVNIVMLAFCSIQDIREKEISLWKLKIYGFLAAAVSIWEILPLKDNLFTLICRFFVGLLPGLFLLILAKITKQAVGYGDGLVLLFIGALWGSGNVSVFCLPDSLVYFLPQFFQLCF